MYILALAPAGMLVEEENNRERACQNYVQAWLWAVPLGEKRHDTDVSPFFFSGKLCDERV